MSRFVLSKASALCLLLVLFYSCDKPATKTSGLVTVSGTWNRDADKGVSLSKVEDGALVELSSCNLASDKSFAIAAPIKEEGFYVLSSDSKERYHNKFVFYIKPDDKLNVDVNDSTYVLTGENSKENKAMKRWHDFMFPLEDALYQSNNKKRVLSSDVFFPLLSKKLDASHAMGFDKTGNSVFDRAFDEYRELDLIHLMLSFYFEPRAKYPDIEQFPASYRDLSLARLSADTRLLRYPYGATMLGQLIYVTQRVHGLDYKEDYHKLLKNDTLIGEMSVQRALVNKTPQAFEEYEKQESPYILTEGQKRRMSNIMHMLLSKKDSGE